MITTMVKMTAEKLDLIKKKLKKLFLDFYNVNENDERRKRKVYIKVGK